MNEIMTHCVENDILIREMAVLLKEGKSVLFRPTGCSMRPFIEGGKDSVELIYHTPVKIGDIALAKINNTYVLHRVIQTTESGLITLMGDGNLIGQEQCSQKDVIGVVKHIISPRGWHKPIAGGWLWRRLLPIRKWLLKLYRHTILKIYEYQPKNK